MNLHYESVYLKELHNEQEYYWVFFSHDVMAAMFLSQNNETAAMFVSQTSPVGVELFSYVNAFLGSNKFA